MNGEINILGRKGIFTNYTVLIIIAVLSFLGIGDYFLYSVGIFYKISVCVTNQ